mmetsp:Transcript_23051/g.46638  ORF Transcript_23051/g.46638 Transcript_23051/m.46638 type:complete len:237 (+) Transcript_23051:151-861(+)
MLLASAPNVPDTFGAEPFFLAALALALAFSFFFFSISASSSSLSKSSSPLTGFFLSFFLPATLPARCSAEYMNGQYMRSLDMSSSSTSLASFLRRPRAFIPFFSALGVTGTSRAFDALRAWKQFWHIRTCSLSSSSGRVALYPVQSEQKIMPQLLQWCFRRKKPKLLKQERHWKTTGSGSHSTPYAWASKSSKPSRGPLYDTIAGWKLRWFAERVLKLLARCLSAIALSHTGTSSL